MRILLAAFGGLLLTGAAPVNWTKTVTRAPNGAYVLGNPKAKVRLVEYLSYSCSHCAHFTKEASAPLKAAFVEKGTVAVEIRHAVRDRYDFTAALLARCGGGTKFFGNNDAIFAAQNALLAKAQSYDAADKLPANSPTDKVLVGVAQGSGLMALMAARGVTPAAARACLTSKAEQDVVMAMAKEAWETRKISGTPALLINDVDGGPPAWEAVELKLRAAVAAK